MFYLFILDERPHPWAFSFLRVMMTTARILVADTSHGAANSEEAAEGLCKHSGCCVTTDSQLFSSPNLCIHWFFGGRLKCTHEWAQKHLSNAAWRASGTGDGPGGVWLLTCAARRWGKPCCTGGPSPLDRAGPRGSAPSSQVCWDTSSWTCGSSWCCHWWWCPSGSPTGRAHG